MPECIVCGAYIPSVKTKNYYQRKTCSNECYLETWLKPNRSIKVNCGFCNKAFTIWRCKFENKNKKYSESGRFYCSRGCQVKGRKLIGGALRLDNRRILGNDGYVWADGKHEHQLIAEQVLGRKLKRGERTHHINGDRTDNRNRNLLICSQGYHRRLHSKMGQLYMKEHFGIQNANR